MVEDLSLDNILGAEEIDNLFSDNEENETPLKQEENESNEGKKVKEATEDINPDDLFDDNPESVGSEDKDKDEEGTKSKEDGTSPKNNFYSSIANALEDEGIFQNLNKDKPIESPEDFAEAVENEIQSRLNERQKRIDDALNAEIEVSEIRKYEGIITYLDSIDEAAISDESEKGERLRKQLIISDLLNKGFSKERAEREFKKSLDSGSDIEDAKEALVSNKEFINDEYKSLINEAQNKEKEKVRERKEQAEKLKKAILEDNKVFGEISLDKATRQKVFETISKPVYKDPNTGELFTALGKYEHENKTDFLKNVGLLFTLTNGFKDIEKLVRDKVQKESRKALRDLEHTLNNTRRSTDGTLQFVGGGDKESNILKGWDLDL